MKIVKKNKKYLRQQNRLSLKIVRIAFLLNNK